MTGAEALASLVTLPSPTDCVESRCEMRMLVLKLQLCLVYGVCNSAPAQ
jgi:hypothetical protein